MAIRHILITIGFFIFLFPENLFAQQDVKMQMAEIKRNESYIKAEANSSEEVVAIDIACKELFEMINSQRAKSGKDSVSIDKIKTDMHSLTYSRGSIKRVLVYMEIEANDTIVSPNDTITTLSSQQPDSIDASSQHSVQSNLSDQAEEKNQTNLIIQNDQTKSTNGSFNDLIMLLGDIEMVDEAVKVLQQFKEYGIISDIGQLKSMSSIDSGVYLVVYDRQRSVSAILRKTDDSFYNIKRDCSDELRNYSGCGSIWFR